MKKLSIISVICSFMLFGCGNDITTEIITPMPPKPEPASINISVTNNTSVLKKDNNTDFIISAVNAYEYYGYKTNIVFNNDTIDNFTINQGNSLFGYMFSLKPNKKETRVYSVDISITDENNNVITSKNILLGALKKLHPAYDTANNIPALDSEKLEITNSENKFVILTPSKPEYIYTKNNNNWIESYHSTRPVITSYGYEQLKDNITKDSNGFTVNDQEEKFTINNTDYKNCIKLRAVSNPCAISISYNGQVEKETSFTINIQDTYLPTTIKLKGIPAPIQVP